MRSMVEGDVRIRNRSVRRPPPPPASLVPLPVPGRIFAFRSRQRSGTSLPPPYFINTSSSAIVGCSATVWSN